MAIKARTALARFLAFGRILADDPGPDITCILSLPIMPGPGEMRGPDANSSSKKQEGGPFGPPSLFIL
jgi:hypothetical protein